MRTTDTRHPPGGFTLIELLVVIAIIGILIAIVLGVAGSVTATGKRALTQDAIRVMETSLNDYQSSKGAFPPSYVERPLSSSGGGLGGGGSSQTEMMPIADARDMSASSMSEKVIINSAGLLVEQFKEVASAYDNIKGLPSEVLKPYSPITNVSGGNIGDLRQPLLTTPIDAWGNPIRFVHPAFDGLLYGDGVDLSDPTVAVDIEDDLGIVLNKGEKWYIEKIRRNAYLVDDPTGEIDSDGGKVQGSQGYFYSAGADGKVGYVVEDVSGEMTVVEDYNADNVYGSLRPALPFGSKN